MLGMGVKTLLCHHITGGGNVVKCFRLGDRSKPGQFSDLKSDYLTGVNHTMFKTNWLYPYSQERTSCKQSFQPMPARIEITLFETAVCNYCETLL